MKGGGGDALFGIGDLVFDPRQDEYLQKADPDDGEDEEEEDFEIRPTDNLILVGHVEGDAAMLEVYGRGGSRSISNLASSE